MPPVGNMIELLAGACVAGRLCIFVKFPNVKSGSVPSK